MRSITFEDLMAAEELPDILLEYLTYDQLFRMSEPKRFQRSLTVKMPPLDMQQYQTGNHWVFEYYFNAKGNPSTTGLRHRGYVRFKKPKRTQAGKNTPLSKQAVEVDCMCPDYRYRWAWANHQRQAGPIGKGSLNQCINKAPRKTNPTGAPGLCKHILATRDYIYGLLSGFPKHVGDTDRLDKLTKKATRRWLNFDQEMEKAKERDAKIAAAKARRNIGLPPEEQNKPIAAIIGDEPPDLPAETPETPPVVTPPEPPKAPEAKPKTEPVSKSKAAPVAGLSPEQFLGRRFLRRESVDITKIMKTLNLQETRVVQNAIKLVEELGEEIESGESPVGDIGGMGGMDDMGEMPPPGGGDMPIEPPVSDSGIRASTEDNVALGLLREIRDLMAQMVSEEGAEGGEMPDLPPDDEGEGEGDGEHAGNEGASEDEGEEFKPGKRPMPVTSRTE